MGYQYEIRTINGSRLNGRIEPTLRDALRTLRTEFVVGVEHYDEHHGRTWYGYLDLADARGARRNGVPAQASITRTHRRSAHYSRAEHAMERLRRYRAAAPAHRASERDAWLELATGAEVRRYWRSWMGRIPGWAAEVLP